MKNFILLAMLAVVLTGCQNTQTNTSAVYQGTDLSKRSKDKEELVRVRTALAGQYIAKNQLDAAQRQLNEVFEIDSRYAPAYDMLGNLLATEGSAANLVKAEESFKKAISLDPEFMQARNNYGVFLSQAGRYNEAVQQFTVAGSTLGYRGRISALENLGLTYLKLGNTAMAEGAFLKAMETDQSSIIAKMEMIDIMIAKKQSLKAREYFDDLKAFAQLHNQPMPARLLFQGVRLSQLQNNQQEMQRLSKQLLSQYPLSDEAKKLKQWLTKPTGALK